MTAWLIANIAPLMFAALIVVLLLGFPVAFSLGAVGIFFGLVGIKLGLLEPSLLQALPERVFGVMSNDTLLAVPFFTFMGLILERSGMAEDLLDTIGQLFGPLRGGLAYAVIFVGALLAATTGVVAASVISMGLISLPIMLRYGYDRRLRDRRHRGLGHPGADHPAVAGADHHGRPARPLGRRHVCGRVHPRAHAGRHLRAATRSACRSCKPNWAPALPPEARTLREPNGSERCVARWSLLVIVAAVAAVAYAKLRHGGPAPSTKRWSSRRRSAPAVAFFAAVINRALKLGLLSRIAERVVFVLIPPLALIFLVLGTIFLGVATPTEGGAMGATGALIMALARRRLSLQAADAGDGHDGEALDLRRLHPRRRDGSSA